MPDGPLRDLNDALHELHGRSGHRSSRFIAERLRGKHGTGAPSHSKVHQLFTRPELPRPELVLWVVQVLAETIRGVDPEAECDRFDYLWRLAYDRRGAVSSRLGAPPPTSLAGLDPAVWADLFPDGVDNITRRRPSTHVNTIHALIGHYSTLAVVLTHLLGPDDPDTLTARHNLAWWQGQAGAPEVAAAALEELLGDRKRVLGYDHPHALSTRHCTAQYLVEAGEAPRGLAMFEELLAEYERLLGSDHSNTRYVRRCVGWAMGVAGNPQGAVDALTEVVARQSLVLDDQHPDALAVRSALASWHSEVGDQRGALAALEELLPVKTQVFGADDFRVFDIRRSMAYLRGSIFGPEVVLAESEVLLVDLTRVLGAEHPDTQRHLSDLATWKADARKRRR